MVVLVSICAGPHPMQPDRASKDSLGNLVLDIGNAICGLIVADVLQHLQVEASVLHFLCQIKKDHWQYSWSLDFLSHISAVALLIVFGFWAGAVSGDSLI